MMSSPQAAVALDLTGPLRRQGRDAAHGLELWAAGENVDLEVLDTAGSVERAVAAYQSWRHLAVQVILGPYGSGSVRRVLESFPAGLLLWNHGGSADDLARPWAPMVPAPASGYFAPLVDLAAAAGCRRVTVVRGSGRFAATVAEGTLARARRHRLEAVEVKLEEWVSGGRFESEAVLVVGRFEDDVAVVSAIKRSGGARLVGCVAAGIPAFGEAAGPLAEGVVGPTQWWPQAKPPELGPSGADFEPTFRRRFGVAPSYVAAQAAAAGYLALGALERGLSVEELAGWSISTLLGTFQVDRTGRQVGHRVSVGRWSGGRFLPVSTPPFS